MPITWDLCSGIGRSFRLTSICSAVSHFLIHYPFANRLFPGSLDAVEHVQQWGQPVILSDGDVVFQPHKISGSGLFELFGRPGADLRT